MSDTITVKGTVHNVLPTETFASGFTKRVLVIKTADKYPQTIPVEFVKDKTLELDGLMPNQEVTALVNLRGSEYKGKYYASIQGWKLQKGDLPMSKKDVKETLAMDAPQNIEDMEDLPF